MPVQRPAQRAVVIWKGRVLLGADLAPLALSGEAFAPQADVVPVFAPGGERVIAYILEAPGDDDARTAVAAAAPEATFADPMRELGRYDRRLRAELVRAVAVERWSHRYRFCPVDGTPLAWTTDHIAKICRDSRSVHRHFPRLDPAIIVLVTHGDRALLGRSARFPPGWYSTLAGFVEPGESVEEALRREVFEEAGIRVGTTRYFGSEPWPFPRSLMLGFFACAQTQTISLHDAELVDARWFDPPELAELQARMKSQQPHFDTIARRLIDAWLAEHPPT